MSVQDELADDCIEITSFASDIDATDYGAGSRGMGIDIVTAGTGTLVFVTAKGNERTLTGLADGATVPVEWFTIKSTTDLDKIIAYLQ